MNGDGYADVVAGAPYYDDGQTDEGRAYVYRGSASGLGASADRTVESDMSWAYLGASVGAAGDVNGDGLADVIVGACQYASGEMKEGNAFVYYGSGAAYTTQTTTIHYTLRPAATADRRELFRRDHLHFRLCLRRRGEPHHPDPNPHQHARHYVHV